MIIAVDFDGTLSTGAEWPLIGEPNISLIKKLIDAQQKGHYIILWSCRNGRDLQEAVDWCEDYGLKFDGVNASPPNKIKEYSGWDTRKIDADIYIDDKAMTPERFCDDIKRF